MYDRFRKVYEISTADTDFQSQLKPVCLLAFLQDIAGEHAKVMGLTREELIEQYGAVWLLARVRITLLRPILAGEMLEITTWHRGATMPIYRDCELRVNGEKVGETTASWVIANMESRAMMRSKQIEKMAASPVPEEVYSVKPGTIRTPESLETVCLREVRCSDLDVNLHMNNTRYAEIVIDALSPDDIQGKFLSMMQINYSVECRYGDCMTVRRCTEGDRYYVDGCSEEAGRYFEAELEFREISP